MVEETNFNYNPSLTSAIDRKIYKLEKKLLSQMQQITKLVESFDCLKFDNYTDDICIVKKKGKVFLALVQKYFVLWLSVVFQLNALQQRYFLSNTIVYLSKLLTLKDSSQRTIIKACVIFLRWSYFNLFNFSLVVLKIIL